MMRRRGIPGSSSNWTGDVYLKVAFVTLFLLHPTTGVPRVRVFKLPCGRLRWEMDND